MIEHNVTACRWLHPEQVVEKIDRATTQKYVEKHNQMGLGP